MQCIILAGGLATRMRPMTETIPKALISVHGKPFIDFQLAWLHRTGVTEVILSIGYRGDQIRDHVGRGERWGLKVNYADEGTELRGTAGAVRLCYDLGLLRENFLVTYGDSFLPVSFKTVFEAHEQSQQPALMTVFKNLGKWDESNVIFEGSRILLYDKKRRANDPTEFQYIDYGLSVLNREIVNERIPSHQKSDLAELFFDLSRSGQLAGWESPIRFYEIGSPDGLHDFEQLIDTDKSYASLGAL